MKVSDSVLMTFVAVNLTRRFPLPHTRQLLLLYLGGNSFVTGREQGQKSSG